MNLQGYVFSRPFMGERVPQHVQNIVIRDYCVRYGFHYLLSATEYAMENCHLILNQVLDDLVQIDGIVAYSLFQLPEVSEDRRRVYTKIMSLGKCMHFAVEGLHLSNTTGIESIESLWRIRKTLSLCPQTII